MQLRCGKISGRLKFRVRLQQDMVPLGIFDMRGVRAIQRNLEFFVFFSKPPLASLIYSLDAGFIYCFVLWTIGRQWPLVEPLASLI